MTPGRLVLVFVLGLAGCKRDTPELPPPVPVDIETLEAQLETLHRDARSVRRYQGFLRIRGKGPDGGFDGRIVVIFERPARLRVELLGAFGSTRWSAVADRDGITVVFPGPRQYVEENDTADIVARLLGVRLGTEEVMALLSGVGTPLDSGAVDGYRRGPITVARLSDGSRIELSDDGQVASVQTSRYRAAYPSSWKSRRRQIPDTIRLETDSLRATLTAEDVDVNVALAPEAFIVEVPEGAARLRPSEIAGEAVFVVTQEER